MSEKLEIVCPCCEAALVVDVATGVVIAHTEKKAAKSSGSIAEIMQDLAAKKESSEKLFARMPKDDFCRPVKEHNGPIEVHFQDGVRSRLQQIAETQIGLKVNVRFRSGVLWDTGYTPLNRSLTIRHIVMESV